MNLDHDLDHDLAALHEAQELIRDVQHRHPLELSGVTITVASLAVNTIGLFERRLLEDATS